jgi:hypothetical protein
VKPRTAGILGMIVALVVTIGFAALIANPSFSIVGAIGLVGGTILFAIAATWTVRKSWDPSNWPDVSVSEEVAMRRFRRLAIVECIFAPLLIGEGVWSVVSGEIDGWVNVALGSVILIIFANAWRAMEKTQRDKSAEHNSGA